VKHYLLCFRLQLTCHLLPAGCCCRLYLLKFAGGSHHTHYSSRLCLEFWCLPLPSSLVESPTSQLQLQASFLKFTCTSATVVTFVHLKFIVGSCQITFSGRLCLFRVCRGNFPFPTFLRSVLHISHCASLVYPKLAGISCQTHLLPQACLYKVCAGAPFSRALKVPCPFCYVSFSVTCFIFSFFPPAWGSDCPGSYASLSQGWLWRYLVPLICSPVGLCLPRKLGVSIWWCRSPLGFSI
jgi:hypothetical protein